MDDLSVLKNIDEKLRALIILTAYSIELGIDPGKQQKTEVLLKNAGFPPAQIAKLVGKKLDTVLKIINRNK